MQDTVPYVIAQVVGAILASLIIGGVVVGTMGEGGLGGTGLGLNMMGEQIEPWKGLLMELVMTAALVFVIFGAAMDKRGLGNIASLAVGFTVVIISLVAIPLTGRLRQPSPQPRASAGWQRLGRPLDLLGRAAGGCRSHGLRL